MKHNICKADTCVLESAPSNIALIKYMGKNPINASLSYTLEHLRTYVQITSTHEPYVGAHTYKGDAWGPLKRAEHQEELCLSEKSSERFLKHFQFLKNHWGLKGHYKIESVNNFPSDCGIASSASSFAALTRATARLAEKGLHKEILPTEQALLSQKGSGSSCRSFFSPWSLWNENGVFDIELPQKHFHHVVIMVDVKKKSVSSSEAHQRVLTSPLFKDRKLRSELRLQDLICAFRDKNWQKAHELCWDEFLEMHEMFHSCQEPFSYMSPQTHIVLAESQKLWREYGDGPLVTMDAGANVHWLFREDQRELAHIMTKKIQPSFSLLCSWDFENGARLDVREKS